MGLTVRRMARLTKPGRYLDRDGLYLVAESATSRNWTLRCQLWGKERWMGLGSVETFSLEEARQRARKARKLLSDGIDPLEARRAERAAQAAAAARNKTFAQVTAEYFDAHSASWSSRKHHGTVSAALKKHAAKLNPLPVAAIDEAIVLEVLRPLWRDMSVTAPRVRRRRTFIYTSAHI